MIIYKYLFCTFSVVVCLCTTATAQSYEWFAGTWKPFSIQPDIVKGEKAESELFISSVTGVNFTGRQQIYLPADTSVQVGRACNGTLSNGDITCSSGKELNRKEPASFPLWDAFVKDTIRRSFFSISQHKLLLHLVMQSTQPGNVQEFVYYRDLSSLPFSLRSRLEKRYGTPQLIDNTDTVKVVRPLEPDMDDTTTYVRTTPVAITLPPDIASRKNTLVKTLQVTSPDIQVILLDDAEIDGDIISLYHNNEAVMNHKTIGKEMVKYLLKADAAHPHHEFTLVAENLGSIPPNTALVRIRSGELKYEFVVHSDMHENIQFVIDYVSDKKIDVTAPH